MSICLYSVGYGNRSVEDFIELLRRHEITHIADVRSVPYSSYQKQFDREALAAWLPSQGFAYAYIGDTLGGAVVRDEQPAAAKLRSAGVSRLVLAAGKPGRRIALMCGCLLPDKCHRGEPLGEILHMAGSGYMHIDRRGELIEHADYFRRVGQASLF